MWFTAGNGWDPADFWADCFEKPLCFSVQILEWCSSKNLVKDLTGCDMVSKLQNHEDIEKYLLQSGL